MRLREASPERTAVRTVLDGIGGSPLVRVDGVWAKCEFLDPSGSVKARIAKYMVERAEEEGLLVPGDTIVEASSGNTGNALAMVAAVKGYRMLVVMPRGMSSERLVPIEVTRGSRRRSVSSRSAKLGKSPSSK